MRFRPFHACFPLPRVITHHPFANKVQFLATFSQFNGTLRGYPLRKIEPPGRTLRAFRNPLSEQFGERETPPKRTLKARKAGPFDFGRHGDLRSG